MTPSTSQLTPMSRPVPPPPTEAVQRRGSPRLFERVSVALPLAGIALGAAFAWGGGRSTRKLGLATLGGSLALAVVRWQLARVVTETALYEVEGAEGDFEIRHYAPSVHAETVVNATEWKASLNEGFHRLAGYIFGGNAARMKIAMTAPVVATIGNSPVATRTISFKMPTDYPLEALPKPDDVQVAIRQIPARRIAALGFAGRYGGAIPAQKKQELLRRVREAGFLPIGEVTFAGYDAPWTLPALRRNEVLVEVSRLRPEAKGQ